MHKITITLDEGVNGYNFGYGHCKGIEVSGFAYLKKKVREDIIKKLKEISKEVEEDG